MTNKKIIILTGILILLILSLFVFYLIVIKPVVIGQYTPSENECIKAYQCNCLNDTCICSFKKWFWENKLVCKRERIEDKQLENK